MSQGLFSKPSKKQAKASDMPMSLRANCCAVMYFLFSEGEEIFFNSILSGWERWKLFKKLWFSMGLCSF